tara:strand:- start:32 stop:868 length:837 start_codon:yes stop_codon:yes gene_type:complete
MILSLSVRIAELFQSKEEASISLQEVGELAKAAGYESLCMRGSQVGVHSSPDEVQVARETVGGLGLGVSMVTGDFAIVYNNEEGPNALRNIGPYLDLAQTLDAPLLRVALKKDEDIGWARRAADEAGERGLKLAHQCHTLSLFETVNGIEETLRRIDRENFGLIYEPANLEICSQDYGAEIITRLAPWIFNVYLQNQVLKDEGQVTLNTWCRGPVSFDLKPIHESGGVDFRMVFEGLTEAGYDGTVTVHQAGSEGESPADSAGKTAEFIRKVWGEAKV